MSALPTGTVTFLFTDIEGSTQRWDEHPDAMRAALEHHDALMRQAVEAHAGQVFKTVGDAFCAAFPTAPAGLAAALDAQRALAAEDWSAFASGNADFAPLTVRMGLHTGAAEERDGDYFGPPLNRCARLQAVGHGGQVLVSLATQQLLRDRLADGVSLRDLGEHRLKDLTHSEHIYQVVAPDLPDVTTPLVTTERLHVGDRIVIDASAEARSLPESLEALRAVVLDETAGATLSPAQVQQIIEHRPADLDAYRLGRIAEWSQPRYRVDGRFVALELLVDKGEQNEAGRWAAQEERYDDLGALLAEVTDPALVVLGPPGAGKSTLLRRYELDTAIRALAEGGSGNGSGPTPEAPITFFVQLNHYRPARLGESAPPPGEWLADRWAARYPDLPSLHDLLADGRMVLLLDALNEMPLPNEVAYREAVGLWKDWLLRLTSDMPGNRVVFSCRNLDYSQPLSTQSLRVPQVRIEPMSDERVREFLQVYSPLHWRDLWARLSGSRQLEVLRSPYFLKLLTEQVEATGEMPKGRAGLFTGFVRQCFRREVEQENSLFAPDVLVSSRDIRRITHWQWKTPYELPERGPLIPKLASLAYGMQAARSDGELSQVRVDYDEALDLLDDERDEDIVRAGVALSVLDEDPAADEVMYVHQLVQEYFAGRELARAFDPELVRSEWRAAAIRPTVDEVIDGLDPADPLPGLPQTGWEETALLAAAMAPELAGFLRALSETNLVLAARCAAQPEVRPRVPPGLLGELRAALIERTTDVEADLRHRIACGQALGDLGDPRFERREGPHGPYLLPPLVEIPAGRYPIGDDEPIEWSWTGASGTTKAHMPRHEIQIEAFRIGRFPVTNAEWACFMAAGGYEDERWWDTEAGRAWRRGELANEAAKANNRLWRKRFLADPGLFDKFAEEGRFPSDETMERARAWNALDDRAFEEALDAFWQAKHETEPRFWRDARFNHPTQPVVGVCWYEARAYCAWLSSVTGLDVRLPTEVEWEAAARGAAGRAYAYGDTFERLRGNTAETHIRQPTPVGVFPDGDTPEGAADLTGNVIEWTSSAFGKDLDAIEYPYPYDADDGREEAEAPADKRRVPRGGAWNGDRPQALAPNRDSAHPDARHSSHGVRVAV
ncbi:MAG: SUMF1/EgtB/PvdO family nonheme iron enzyme [Caldilineae bacterium]|nr:SUMF1/EgtB/PvdO family nonheme iron enzyme [Chloroflexota bacterium]MCB9176986.1 SUMF1/EgtB/PvdO family nonheme iron enzyme [Caldilineae bacterium]